MPPANSLRNSDYRSVVLKLAPGSAHLFSRRGHFIITLDLVSRFHVRRGKVLDDCG
jgi:hypothetical protein